MRMLENVLLDQTKRILNGDNVLIDASSSQALRFEVGITLNGLNMYFLHQSHSVAMYLS